MMIKANELRIGNYILENSDPSNVYMIDRGGISFYRINDIPVNKETGCTLNGGEDRFKPLPLTTEWLENCGFVKDRNGWHLPNTQFSLTENLFPCWLDRMLWPGGLPDFNNIQLQYVHQLQNLYFALTGKEIEIKEPAQK